MADNRKLLEQAFELHGKGDLDSAEPLYRQLLADDPDNATGYYLLGCLTLERGRPDVAIDLLQKAIDLKPGFAEAHAGEGDALCALGRHVDAVASYEQAVAHKPDFPAAWYNLGNTQALLGQTDEAVQSYRQAIRHDAGFAAAHHNLGGLYLAAGRLVEAEQHFAAATRLAPDLFEAHQNLGATLRERGKHRDAAASFVRALRLRPDCAEAHLNLGNALAALHDYDRGADSLREAIRLDPGYTEAMIALALVLEKQGALAEAEAALQQAIAVCPDDAEALCDLGDVLRDEGRLEEAVGCYRRALAKEPARLQALNNLGGVLHALGRHAEAVEPFQRAIEADERCAAAHANLAGALLELGHTVEAAAAAQRALDLDPDSPDAHNNLGIAHQLQGDLADAQVCYESAVALSPRHARAHSNLGSICQQLGDTQRAVERHLKAIDIEPGFAGAHLNLAFCYLQQGRFEEGWREYEWRFAAAGYRPAFTRLPEWAGAAAEERVLVWAEQGLGDTIQFVRYLPLMRERGAKVTLACQPALAGYLHACRLAEDVIELGHPDLATQEFDRQIGLLSLPRVFGTNAASIPAAVPYLRAGASRVEKWAKRLAGEERLKVGLVWAGNPEHRNDRERSCKFPDFAALAAVPGVALYSLQKGAASQTGVARLRDSGVVDLSSQLGDLADTAAAICALDLVVSVDTLAAHLAGALARPVWTMLPASADWRWLEGRDDTPWYPTMRLFRQSSRGDWRELFARLCQALAERAAQSQVDQAA